MMIWRSLVLFLGAGAVAWLALGSPQIFLAGKAALRYCLSPGARTWLHLPVNVPCFSTVGAWSSILN